MKKLKPDVDVDYDYRKDPLGFYFNPAVYMNRLGETIIVTGYHDGETFEHLVALYDDDYWEYICDL